MDQERGELWDFVGALLCAAANLFGRVEELLGLRWSRAQHKEALAWVRSIEGLVRPLVLAEALEIVRARPEKTAGIVRVGAARRPNATQKPFQSLRFLRELAPQTVRARSASKEAKPPLSQSVYETIEASPIARRLRRLEALLADPTKTARRLAPWVEKRLAKKFDKPMAGSNISEPPDLEALSAAKRAGPRSLFPDAEGAALDLLRQVKRQTAEPP